MPARRAEVSGRPAGSGRTHLKRLILVAAGGIVAAGIAALSFGLVPAVEAALGSGTTGSFIVSHQICSARTGCAWAGTFEARDGQTYGPLAYGGTLPAGDGPGSVIPARYPRGSDQVFAARGSYTWIPDLLATIVIGAIAGAALWISPLGTGDRGPVGVRARGA